MSRIRVALILPIRFSVRGFLQTDVFDRLRSTCDLLLISPFASSQEFRSRFNGHGVEHATLHDFLPVGSHDRWYRRYLKARQKQLGLSAQKSIEDIKLYNHRARYSRLPVRDKIKLWFRNRALPALAGNRLGVRWLDRAEKTAYLREDYAFHSDYLNLLTGFKPDLVVSTSPNRYSEIPLARAVETLRIPHFAYVLSFDNIVCYPDFPRIYDKYMVWNGRNKAELLARYPSLREDQIVICGPLQFDFYARRAEFIMPRELWLTENGLPKNSPIILYAETGPSVAPHEPEIVADLALRLGKVPKVERPALLVRTHPMHTDEHWRTVMEQYPDVRFQSTNNRNDDQRAERRIRDFMDWDHGDISQLINTLHHADVHLNIASTMAIDAAYFDRPSIGIAYDPRPDKSFDQLCKDLYRREHLYDMMRSNAVPLATSPDEVLPLIMKHLADPSLNGAARQKMLSAYDPFGDGKAAERVANVIVEYLERLIHA